MYVIKIVDSQYFVMIIVTINIMMNQIKNRKKYVEKRLGFKIHTNIRTRDI